VVETAPLLVIKKDGRREPFSRDKILNGILRACEKRPIPAEKIHAIVDAIENDLARQGVDEVQSSVIGERVMEELHRLDEVAYVRFASVYRHFKDLNQFLEELRSLLR
jgi:transcriptional repressor NrdR